MSNKNKKFQALNVLTISFAHFFHDIHTAFLPTLLPKLIEKLNLNYSLAGFLSVMQRAPSLLNPFVGIIAEKVTFKYFIIAAPALTAITMSLLGTVPHYYIMIILLLLSGISTAIFHVPAPVMIKSVSGNRVGKGMSFYMLGGELARTLGPLIILGALSLWGIEGTYKLIPFSLVVSFVIFMKLKNLKVDYKFKKKGDFRIRDTLRQFASFFIIISGIVLFRSVMKSALTIFLPTYLSSKGFNLAFGGISLSVIQFSGAIGTSLSGAVSDKIGRKRSLLILAIINPFLMLLFTLVEGPLAVAVLFIIGFFLFSMGPVLLALVQDLNANHPAMVNGIYMTINFILSSLMVMVIGFIGDRIGLALTYRIAAFVSFATVPFVFFLKNDKIKKI